MLKTGVFATKEEIALLEKPIPYLLGSDGVAPRSSLEKCHSMALKHGLPEIPGYYGIDLKTGEFLYT
jgi:hypothetical protein